MKGCHCPSRRQARNLSPYHVCVPVLREGAAYDVRQKDTGYDVTQTDTKLSRAPQAPQALAQPAQIQSDSLGIARNWPKSLGQYRRMLAESAFQLRPRSPKYWSNLASLAQIGHARINSTDGTVPPNLRGARTHFLPDGQPPTADGRATPEATVAKPKSRTHNTSSREESKPLGGRGGQRPAERECAWNGRRGRLD